MITTTGEHEKAQSELRDSQERLAQLQRDQPIGDKGFTKMAIRKLIARPLEHSNRPAIWADILDRLFRESAYRRGFR